MKIENREKKNACSFIIQQGNPEWENNIPTIQF